MIAANPGTPGFCDHIQRKLRYKIESPEAMTEFESAPSGFGVTTGRFSAGENLTVGEGVRITLLSEPNIALYTDRLHQRLHVSR